MQDTQPIEITPSWIRPSEWQARTGMSHGQTYRALWSGELRAVMVGRCHYIYASELSSYFLRHGKRAAESAAA